MKMTRIIRMLAALYLAQWAAHGAQIEDMASRSTDIGFGWKFHLGDAKGAEVPDFDVSAWRNVDLPHDWSIEGQKEKKNPGGNRIGYFPTGIGWYRKAFTLPAGDQGKQIGIQFDGVYRDSEVWINGKSLGRRPNGYASFHYDLTPHVKFGGANLIAVRVDNSAQPNSRWYTGSGIYRNIHLTVTDKLHVAPWGTSVTTPEVTPGRAKVRIETKVANKHEGTREAELLVRIIGPDGRVESEKSTKRTLAKGMDSTFVQDFEVPNPKRWSVASPNLYQAECVIRVENRDVDRVVTTFGIRSIGLDKNRGFVLNGLPLKMKGVNVHHDAGSLGSAVPIRALERRLEVLKSIGCNAIRTSHNPPAPELLDLCDRMGFVVIDEAFDKWGKPYNRSFSEWGERDLKDMIRRDRNHPSVVMWSMGNELENQGEPDYLKQLEELVRWARESDSTRPVTVALRPKETSASKMTKEVLEIATRVDAISCNYQESWFENYRKANPDLIIIGSEIYPYFRGDGDNYKAFKPVNPWLDAAKHDYVAGSFYWTGIDYLGEAVAGWPFHGWNGSLIDTCGWVRPVGHLARSFWTDEPMVHIAVMDKAVKDIKPTKDHWGWPAMRSHWTLTGKEGKTVKVATFTNCQEVELRLNGKSLGKKKLSDFPDRMITWEVPYTPGRLEARGIVGGVAKASNELRTAGAPAQLILTADRKAVHSDGRDLSYLDVVIADKDGVPVPNEDQQITFQIEGPGKIIGVDNGDLTSMESYKGNSRKTLHGRAQAIIQTTRQAGRITINAEAEGLNSSEITLESR